MNSFQFLQAIACVCTIATFACTFFDITAKDIDPPSDRVQKEKVAKR
jgi:hypothetical protein